MPERRTLNSDHFLKVDLHCHSYFSGKTNHVKPLEPMDCYSSPAAIYHLAKARGMDLVTITDHDSIEGCLNFLDRFPEKNDQDFIIGEEVTVQLPEFKSKIHVAVYDITEAQHNEISRLRSDFDELLVYLRRNQIIHGLNHIFHGFPMRQYGRSFLEKMLDSFEIFEGLNGAIGRAQNNLISQVIQNYPGKVLTAGSDAHTLVRLGSCYTVGEGRCRKDFLHSLRTGKVTMAGKSGRFTSVFGDAMGVYLAYFRDLTIRNLVHREWPVMKKVRNGLGWLAYLPVFSTLSFAYSVIYYQLEARREPYYRQLIDASMAQRGLTEYFSYRCSPKSDASTISS